MAALGARRGRTAYVESAQHAALAVFVLVTTCILLLIYAFLTFDSRCATSPTTRTSARRSTTRITRCGARLEGSIVLWSWMLTVYTLVRGAAPPHERARALSVRADGHAERDLLLPARDDGGGAVFARSLPIPADGRGSTAAGRLRHDTTRWRSTRLHRLHGAVRLAIAALITGRVGDFWITTTRRWTILAWYFLALGLLIGGWWSYHVLGWGGYWAWDPSRTPPSCRGSPAPRSALGDDQERRRMLRLWNIALVILTSASALRHVPDSLGVIASVHAFTQGAIGSSSCRSWPWWC